MDAKMFKMKSKIYKQIDDLEVMLKGNNELNNEKLSLMSDELENIRNHYDNIFVAMIDE